jgi:FkbM family methyltransferase
MIPKVIHFTIPENPVAEQIDAIRIARDLLHGWTINVWQDPIDTRGLLLENYYPKANSGAQYADLLRLDIIYKYGGIYLDSDIIIKKDLTPLLTLDNFFCSENGTALTNAAFGAKPKSQLIFRLINALLEHEPDWSAPPNESTGPKLFSRTLRWDASAAILPRETFYPYNWNEPEKAPSHTTLGVHKWSASWLEPRKRNRHARKRRNKNFVKIFARTITHFAEDLKRNLPPIKTRAINAYPSYTDLTVKTNRGIFLSLIGHDLSVTPQIALNQKYEEAELKFVEQTLRGGDWFIDVGANVGVYSLLAARNVGPFGRVFAIEANPLCIQHLKKSLLMNYHHDRVVIYHGAVGEGRGKTQLSVPKERIGDGSILPAPVWPRKTIEGEAPGDDLEFYDVELERLDSLFPLNLEVKILKIDVEGAEYCVLQGAWEMIQNRCIKFILIELIKDSAPEVFAKNIEQIRRIISCGYEIKIITRSGNAQTTSGFRSAIENSRKNILLERIQ